MTQASPKRRKDEAVGRAQPLSELAYARIKERILMGDIPPFAPIDERALMEQLNVGRTPIREALQRLAHEGLVTILPYRGMVASGIDIADLDQILEVRIPLEIMAGRHAALRITPKQLEDVRSLIEGYDVPGLCEEMNVVELLHLDQRFHRAVTCATDNRFLVRILDNLRDMTWRFYFLFYRRRPPRPTDSFNNYDAIIRALAKRDPDLLEARLHEHFRDSRRMFPSSPGERKGRRRSRKGASSAANAD